jgi:hypothetical protein
LEESTEIKAIVAQMKTNDPSITTDNSQVTVTKQFLDVMVALDKIECPGMTHEAAIRSLIDSSKSTGASKTSVPVAEETPAEAASHSRGVEALKKSV